MDFLNVNPIKLFIKNLINELTPLPSSLFLKPH
jgi:hypothetical protein